MRVLRSPLALVVRTLVFRPTVKKDVLELLKRGDENKDVSVNLSHARSSKRCTVQVGGFSYRSKSVG